jgi:phage shock protein PspC (stress-responsive transcriptional regulator)
MGIGRHFDLNVTILRIVWVLLFLFYGIGGILYLVLWALMPNEA